MGHRAMGSVLIVEDSPTQALKLKYVLEEAGYTVTIAIDGEDGLQKARQIKPHIIISDVNMPKMDGFELCRAIKNDASLSTVPFVLLTTLTEMEDVVKGLNVAADSYVTKPYDNSFLISKVASIIAGGDIHVVEGDRQEIEVSISGKLHKVTSSRENILKLLLSTYENAVLQNKDLLTTKKALESAVRDANQANQSKSIFLANMSHEIRTPMNAILGFSQLALQLEMAPKLRDYVKKIERSGTALLQVINDILDFSKIEAGKLDIEQIDFNIYDVLNNVAIIVGHEAQRKSLEFNFSTDPKIPSLLVGDPLRLGQVLNNLCNNAMKFTESGQILVSVTAAEKDAQTATIQFSVKDTGIGMSAAQQKRLFQAFSQADASMTRKFGGTGLGLTICKRLVELMGGRIWVDSTEGAGSEFFFVIPFPISRESKTLPAIPPDLRQLRVLIADDNPAAQEMLKRMLEMMTFEVTAVDNGEAAIMTVEGADTGEAHYQLVIADWKMPGIDGIETIRRIKASSRLRHIPAALIISGFGVESFVKDAKKAGADGFLEKPLTSSTLFDTIAECYGKNRRAGAPRQMDMPGEEETLRQIRGAKILLVEDNEINQEVAMEILTHEGFVVTIANNGQEAVSMVAEAGRRAMAGGTCPYDLVLMDIQMPVMDGYAATREIRNLDTAINTIPVIAMTAHTMTGDMEKCIAAGMNGHVAKPIDQNQLFTAMTRWIRPAAASSVEAVDEGSEDDGFPDALPGIDITEGLAKVGGNPSFFKKILVKFAARYNHTVTDIQSALETDDRKSAIRHVHTLKGLAGSIGAHDLQAAAAALEADIYEEKEPLTDAINRLSEALEEVIAGLTVLQVCDVEQAL